MPTLPKRACAHPGCPGLAASSQYCPTHAELRARDNEAWKTTQTSASSRGYGARWRRLRQMILRRDPVCKLCHAKPSQDVDHVVPKSQGGEDTEENLRGVCRRCHQQKTAGEGVRARTRAR